MTEEMIINNKTEREKLIQRIEVLEKVKKLLLIPNSDFATVRQVAEFYEVEEDTIVSIYNRHFEELKSDGMCVVKYKELSNFQYESLKTSKGKVTFFFEDGTLLDFSTRGQKVFPRRAILRIGMLLRDSKVAKEVRTQLLNIEGKTSDEIKVSSVVEEENLLMNIALAYKSGEIDKLMVATSAYSKFQSRYIKELEAKAKIADEMINCPSVTTVITQRIKDTDVAKKWKKEIKNKELGETAQSVLVFVHDFINKNGFSPTVREIGNGVGLKSTSSVQAHMDKLNNLGYLVKDYKKTRNIRVNEDKYLEIIK